MDILIFIAVAAVFIIIAYRGQFRHDRLMRDGRPVMAIVENVRPVSSDNAGKTTIVYTLNIEGRLV